MFLESSLAMWHYSITWAQKLHLVINASYNVPGIVLRLDLCYLIYNSTFLRIDPILSPLYIEGNEDQSQVTCPRPHNYQTVELGFF